MGSATRRGLVVFVISALTVAALGDIAQAWTCGAGNFCIWTDPHHAGTKKAYAGNISDWPVTIDYDDETYENNGTSGDYVVRTYQQSGYTGGVISCLPRGWGADPPTPKNSGDSHRWEKFQGSGATFQYCTTPGP